MSEATVETMDKSNVYALAALLAVAGFLVGKWDAKPAAAPAAAVVPAAPTAPAQQGSAAPTPAAQVAAAPAAPPPAPPPPRPTGLSSQTDEGAGKGADLDKIAKSPADGVPYVGEKDGLVLVTVFSDFQCPVCKRSADPIKQLVLDFPGQVRVNFRHNALAMHGRSQPSAIAAVAAQKQGKFWQYHDKLFQTARLDDAGLRQHATDLGLDATKFGSDLADGRIVEKVRRESKMAEDMGASGTPAFFINGQRQVGWGSYMALKSMVAREITAGKELIAGGTKKEDVVKKRILATAGSNQREADDPIINPKSWADWLTGA